MAKLTDQTINVLLQNLTFDNCETFHERIFDKLYSINLWLKNTEIVYGTKDEVELYVSKLPEFKQIFTTGDTFYHEDFHETTIRARDGTRLEYYCPILDVENCKQKGVIPEPSDEEWLKILKYQINHVNDYVTIRKLNVKII